MTNNTTFPGILTCPTSSVSNAMTMGTTKTYVVTMTNASGANKYYIDGYLQASLVLHQGQTYIFDLSSSTLSGHPFEFSTTNNGSHGGGSAYSTGITTTGTYADDQTRKFVVSTSTPTTLYYYCTAHSGMGGSVTISPKAELIVSGGAEFIGTGTIKLPSGTTSERPTTGVVGMIRYNTTTGYMETYTSAGWGSIAAPPVVTDVSPVTVVGGNTATQVFTVTGTGFDANLVIKLVGADGTEYSVFSTTYVSGLQATFKMGANGASGGYDAAQKPFKVRLTGGSGLASTLDTPTITIAAPTITGVSPTTLAVGAVGSQTITVTGTGFTSSMASGNNIQVLGANGSTLYNVDSAAVASATSITFKLAATGASLSSGQLAQRPYKVRVTGGAGLTATSTQTIGFTGISWTSPAAGATLTYNTTGSVSTNLVATDDVGGTDVTYSITSGSVGGLSLGSATASPATYSGTGSSSGTTNVTFRVTDNVTGSTLDRTFSIVVSPPPLFAFTTHTFTSGAVSYPYTGPTLTQLRSAYTPSWTDNSSYLNVVTQGIQRFTIPEDGNYKIEAVGAQGAHSQDNGPPTGAHPSGQPNSYPASVRTLAGGFGAYARGTMALSRNDVLQIMVGQAGGGNINPSGAYYNSSTYTPGRDWGGGGGGSFVAMGSGPNNNVPLVVAGGGGGMTLHTRGVNSGQAYGVNQQQVNANGEKGATGTHWSVDASATTYANGGYNATRNAGSGQGGTSTGYQSRPHNGGGFYTSGLGRDSPSYPSSHRYYSGRGFLQGGQGGYNPSSPGVEGAGGFGGGAAGDSTGRAGAGGGWNGGNGTNDAGTAGGITGAGSSYVNSTLLTSRTTVRDYNYATTMANPQGGPTASSQLGRAAMGRVIITKV